jgi:GPH family glycoside/pentoside/hexuronide:cation symporter
VARTVLPAVDGLHHLIFARLDLDFSTARQEKRLSFRGSASLSWLWASAAEPIWVFLLRTVLIGFGSGSLIGMSQSMLPDTIEFDRIKSGLNREGIFAGFTTTVEKASVAFGIAAVGLVLGLTGYVKSPTPGVVQPQSAIDGICICFAVMPALFLALSGLVMLFYPITEASLRNMRTSEIEVRAIGALAP